MAKTKQSAHQSDRPGIKVSDPNGAPLIYFEGAPNAGHAQGIVSITLAAHRLLADGDRVNRDIVAVAFLRCNTQAAIELRNAIDKALLLAAKPVGDAN